MNLIVQKYGGTSVASIERIKAVAKRVAKNYNQGKDVAVVLSAMAGVTDELIKLAHEATQGEEPDPRELDTLLATGEQQTVALLAMTLQDMGYSAESVLGHQAGIQTDSNACNAFIIEIESSRIKDLLANRIIPIITGFQGCDERGNITTLGRGGSDTSAVAIAIALKADLLEILTDVDGIYTTNPAICATARKIKKISFDDMLELASLGAKVLHKRSVELAKKHNLPIHLRSSFNEEEGTMVINGKGMESPIVSGVVAKNNQAEITFKDVSNQPGIAAEIFKPLNAANISVDMIVQTFGTNGNRESVTNVSFTVEAHLLSKVLKICQNTGSKINASNVSSASDLAKISIVGSGMVDSSGVAAKMFETLGLNRINIYLVSTSETRISVIVKSAYAELAVRALHSAFGLDEIK